MDYCVALMMHQDEVVLVIERTIHVNKYVLGELIPCLDAIEYLVSGRDPASLHLSRL